jgi:hypothetical protein
VPQFGVPEMHNFDGKSRTYGVNQVGSQSTNPMIRVDLSLKASPSIYFPRATDSVYFPVYQKALFNWYTRAKRFELATIVFKPIFYQLNLLVKKKIFTDS